MKPMNIIIAGGGTMGTSLVQIFSQNSFPVTLYSRREETLARARENILINQQALIAQHILTAGESSALTDRITFTNSKSCFSGSWVFA